MYKHSGCQDTNDGLRADARSCGKVCKQARLSSTHNLRTQFSPCIDGVP